MMESIEAIVQDILNAHVGPWPEDITDLVFLAIEHDPDRLAHYKKIVRELNTEERRGQQIVNQYIGRRVKQLTTGVNRGRNYAPESTLIQSYERH